MAKAVPSSITVEFVRETAESVRNLRDLADSAPPGAMPPHQLLENMTHHADMVKMLVPLMRAELEGQGRASTLLATIGKQSERLRSFSDHLRGRRPEYGYDRFKPEEYDAWAKQFEGPNGRKNLDAALSFDIREMEMTLRSTASSIDRLATATGVDIDQRNELDSGL